MSIKDNYLTESEIQLYYTKALKGEIDNKELTGTQLAQILNYAKRINNEATTFIHGVIATNPEYPYPDKYKNGKEFEYWTLTENKYRDSKIVIERLEQNDVIETMENGYKSLIYHTEELKKLKDFLVPNSIESDIDYLESNIKQGLALKRKVENFNIFKDLEAIYLEKGKSVVEQIINRLNLSYKSDVIEFIRYYNKRTFINSKEKVFLYKTAELKRLIYFANSMLREILLEINNFKKAYLFKAELINSHNVPIALPLQKAEKKTDKQKPELNVKLITFKNSETIDKIHSELKGFFPKKEAELLKALQGEQLSEILLFPHNGSSFVEVFKRLKYSGFLMSTQTDIKDWICENFNFVKTVGKKKTVESFKENSVWDVLTKEKCQPSKKNRICTPDWLPFISQRTRQREKGDEKI